MNSDFYVGYQPAASTSVRRTIRAVALLLAGLCLVVAVVLIVTQGPFAASRFEYGVYRDYDGELVEWPYPALITSNGHYLLVGPGKFGVADLVRGHDGSRVRLRGSLIARGQDQMLEIDPASFQVVSRNALSTRQVTDLGPVMFTGEIVDTKCHLGVMNPGDGKVHRDCAARCISGGAPPGFLVRDAAGETRLLLLTRSDGRPIGREVLDYVAEPIRITGRLERSGTTLVLLAEPKDFHRE